MRNLKIRYGSLENKFSLILFCLQFDDCPLQQEKRELLDKILLMKRKRHPCKNLTLGLALIGLGTTGLIIYWCSLVTLLTIQWRVASFYNCICFRSHHRDNWEFPCLGWRASSQMVRFSIELFDLYLLLFRYGVNVFYITIHLNDCTLLVLHFSLVKCPASNCADNCGWLPPKCSAIGIGFNGAETNCGIERRSRYVTRPW